MNRRSTVLTLKRNDRIITIAGDYHDRIVGDKILLAPGQLWEIVAIER